MKLTLTRAHETDADPPRRWVEAMQSRFEHRYGARTEWESPAAGWIASPARRDARAESEPAAALHI